MKIKKKQFDKIKNIIDSIRLCMGSSKSEDDKLKDLENIFLVSCEDILLNDLMNFGELTDDKTKKMFNVTIELAQYSIDWIKSFNSTVNPDSNIAEVLSLSDQSVKSWIESKLKK